MPIAGADCGLQDMAALWSIGAASPQAVVRCACDALVAGLDTPSLRILAGLTRAEADNDMPDILPAALAELGLDYYARGASDGQQAAVRVLAAQAVSGSLTPRALAAEIHRYLGHGLPLAERLAALDDEYDIGFRTRDHIDQEVMTEARRLAG